MGTKKYKLKTNFDDFYVEERHAFKPLQMGKYVLFKLEKTNLDTISSLKITSKQIKVPRKYIGYSGLKDRYSRSCQFISVPKKYLEHKNEPVKHDFEDNNIKVSFEGYLDSTLKLGSHSSNFFNLTIRRMNSKALNQLKTNLDIIRKGIFIPNYFDSQKFGFIKSYDNFPAARFIHGDYETALKLIIAMPNRKERPRSKIVHSYLHDNWKDWKACSEFLRQRPFENYLKLTSHLEGSPDDFLGALKMLSPDILKLKITALQAYLWNELLKSELKKLYPENTLADVKYNAGEITFFSDPGLLLTDHELNSESGKNQDLLADNETFPLPSPGVKPEFTRSYNRLLLDMFGIKDLSEFEEFSTLGYLTNAHERCVFFKPDKLTLVAEGRDEDIKKEKNRYCTISFELPPGSYATVLVKAMLLA